MAVIPTEIKREAAGLKVTVRIGRNGITESLKTEIADQLRKSGLLKLKLNRGLIETSMRKQFWSELAADSAAELIDQKGNVAVFWKR